MRDARDTRATNAPGEIGIRKPALPAAEVKAARAHLGVSLNELAKMLRMGANGDRKIRRWEDGDLPISGPASVALEALLTGWRPAGGEGRSPGARERQCPEKYDVGPTPEK